MARSPGSYDERHRYIALQAGTRGFGSFQNPFEFFTTSNNSELANTRRQIEARVQERGGFINAQTSNAILSTAKQLVELQERWKGSSTGDTGKGIPFSPLAQHHANACTTEDKISIWERILGNSGPKPQGLLFYGDTCSDSPRLLAEATVDVMLRMLDLPKERVMHTSMAELLDAARRDMHEWEPPLPEEDDLKPLASSGEAAAGALLGSDSSSSAAGAPHEDGDREAADAADAREDEDADLGELADIDPIPPVAQIFASKVWVLVIDDWHIPHVTDAMIVRRYFTNLFDSGVFVVGCGTSSLEHHYISTGVFQAKYRPTVELLQSRIAEHHIVQ